MKKITASVCITLLIANIASAQAIQKDSVKKIITPVVVQTPEQKAMADTRQADYDNMLTQLHITTMRPGRSGTKGKPNYANYDESKANIYPNLPDPLIEKSGKKVKSAKEWWTVRRPEIVEDFDRELYGRVPKDVPPVTWTIVSSRTETINDIPVITKILSGHADNTAFPSVTVNIELSLTTPVNTKKPVPVILIMGPGGPARASNNQQATHQLTPKEQLIQKGWGYAYLTTGSIQADNGAGLTKGIIGLTNKGQYRKPDDWGVLRAWAWGANRAMDYFETDKAVNAKEVGIEGVSRWGKGTIVTMAYDQRFAIACISSSGEGGIKLHRRDLGEVVENVTAIGEYHWMAGNFLKYGGPLNWNDLPVDAHELAALCAPRPILVTAGSEGDECQDAQGMFMAAAGADPVYKLLGKKGLNTTTMPVAETMISNDIAFRHRKEGHTDIPDWPFFINYASLYFK
jgi:hypothetical protein